MQIPWCPRELVSKRVVIAIFVAIRRKKRDLIPGAGRPPQ
jgi:hypothetical protein